MFEDSGLLGCDVCFWVNGPHFSKERSAFIFRVTHSKKNSSSAWS
jgi:hypothetical protein